MLAARAKAKPKPKPADEGYRIVEASFLAGAPRAEGLPPPVRAEIAFAGRSNVGKSSLINTLVERRNLVRTSSTPGATRQLNLFEARARDDTTFHLVDLPGYGFSKRSKTERGEWAKFVEDYLKNRVTLAAVVLVVDARRGVEEDDRELIDFIQAATGAQRRPVQVVVVATKTDKVPSPSRQATLARLGEAAGRKVVGFSSVTGEGRDVLWRALRRAALGSVPADAGRDEPEAGHDEPDVGHDEPDAGRDETGAT